MLKYIKMIPIANSEITHNKSFKKLLVAFLVALLVILISGGLYFFILAKNDKESDLKSVKPQESTAVNSPDASIVNEYAAPVVSAEEIEYQRSVNSINEYPVRMRIPALKVDAPIVALGIDSEGRVEVTDINNLDKISWFQPGGAAGFNNKNPALFSGHYSGNSPDLAAVFDELDKIKEGNDIEVLTAGGVLLKYKVSRVLDYEVADVPMKDLLTANGQDRIEIITCGGAWNEGDGYTKRTVVTALRSS